MIRYLVRFAGAAALFLMFSGPSAADELSAAKSRIDALDGIGFAEEMIGLLHSRAVNCEVHFTPEEFGGANMPPEMARALFDRADTPLLLRAELLQYLEDRMKSADRPVGSRALFDAQFELIAPRDGGWLIGQRDCRHRGS